MRHGNCPEQGKLGCPSEVWPFPEGRVSAMYHQKFDMDVHLSSREPVRASMGFLFKARDPC